MTARQLFCILIGILLLNLPIEARADVVVIKPQGKKAECYIFPLVGRERKPSPKGKKILTGVFSGKNEEHVLSSEEEELVQSNRNKTLEKKRKKTKKDANTIAWITTGALLYHDPFLECASGTDRIWISTTKDLCGLQPCEECFKKNAHAPGFIVKESGGIDIASAAALLSNEDFLVWAQERLPIKNPGFISSEKLMIYPKMEMTDNGLLQLARETEQAYRRHTWKTIEVVGKKSATDTADISSFQEDMQGDD